MRGFKASVTFLTHTRPGAYPHPAIDAVRSLSYHSPVSVLTKGNAMQNYEKLGAFYLGKTVDPETRSATDDLLLYDAKDLTTHGVIVGMTGSGKTGLAVSLIEEAAIDGVPVIAIDPKGDLGNLLLTFPDLAARDFRPWIDEAEAARQGLGPDAYAEKTAAAWRDGLAAWGQPADRIQRFRDAAELAIYTPGNTSGRPLQILRSFAAPPAAVLDDASALRDRVLSATSGLLGLVGIDADPIQSREHILLSTLFDRAWREGRDLDLPALIGGVQMPPFERIGVLDLEAFYPAKERFGLAMALNNLLASPGFSAWLEGEPLNIASLLYTPEGKPRVSVLSIAHLSDAERMFFVTILLTEILTWTRAQSGTGSLRALVYMDEIYGYFPPTANPPSKVPMLTLLKQARAFGVGVVLATQNPVDLDYKGLANCGTWFIGRLQTERDKARVIEGLEGAAAGCAFDRGRTEALLASLGNRVFLMRNAHDAEAALFQTRWTLSYLRGPLTLPQIKRLTPSAQRPEVGDQRSESGSLCAMSDLRPPTSALRSPPTVPAGLTVLFARTASPAPAPACRPAALGQSNLHFVDAKLDVDAWLPYSWLAPLDSDTGAAIWEEAARIGDPRRELDRTPAAGATFEPLPAALTAKAGSRWKSSLADFINQTVTLDLFSCAALGLASQPGEAEGAFRARLAQAAREHRDAETERLRARYAPKLQALEDRLRRAEERVEREKAQYGQHKMQTALAFGSTLLGALMGRRVLSRAATAMRTASRTGKEKADVARADESAELVQQRLDQLNAEFEQEVAALAGRLDPAALTLDTARVRPRKSDISVADPALAWVPRQAGADT